MCERTSAAAGLSAEVWKFTYPGIPPYPALPSSYSDFTLHRHNSFADMLFVTLIRQINFSHASSDNDACGVQILRNLAIPWSFLLPTVEN